MPNFSSDQRVVLTLDAGGTSLRFNGMRAGTQVTPMISLDTHGDNLDLCLANIVHGFARVRAICPAPPIAISFAFPGPADYPNGIIGDLGNLPGFRGGVALGPMLEEKFGVPVFINNDGDMFAYGEGIAGFLPYVNGLLEKSGSSKRYKNLLAVTLGTGFGGGIFHNGELFTGDNSMAGEIWALRNKLTSRMNVEEGVSIRAVRRHYAREAGISLHEAPDPHMIGKIALGEARGNAAAALEAYRRLGEVAGDAIGNALTLIDGLAVIGGGISTGHKLFLPTLVDELNGDYVGSKENKMRRLVPMAFNLEDPLQLGKFLEGEPRKIAVPHSSSQRKVEYDSFPRIGVGISRLGTTEAVAVGAYEFALRMLDRSK